MIEEEIANEIEDIGRQQIRIQQAQPSWVSLIQSKIVSQVQVRTTFKKKLNQTEVDDKHDTNLGITPGRTERDPLFQSKHGSSVFFREDFGKSSMSDFDPSLAKYRTQPHEVNFRVKVFIKYLALRVLFTIIGPLILVYGIFNEEWLHFMSNFRNYGLSKLVFWNYFRWVSNYVILFAFVFYIQENGINKVYYEVIFAILVYLVENVTYAIKYAFFHPSKLVLIEKYSLCFVGDSCEQSINPMLWAKQCPSMLDREIEQSMKRLQIEPTSFHMYFMVAPNSERFERIKIQRGVNHANEVDRKFIEHQGGDCLQMVKEIVNHFNQNCQFTFSVKISLFISLIKVSTYIVLMMYCKDQSNDILIMIISGLLQFVYFLFVIILMMLTYRDLRRKVFAMTQLSHLISAEKVEVYQEQKLFPTLNLLCIVSLYSWFNLRRLILDYGLQYTRRSSFMLSFIMSIHTVMMAIIILLFYCQIITITSLICSTVDFIIIASIFIALVLQGARINAHWNVHRGLLRKNLFLIQQLSYQIFKNYDYTYTPQDPVFAAFQKILDLSTTQTVVNDDQFLNYSLFCLHSIQHVYDDLGHQKTSQPYTVIGIAMTYEMLLQVCVSVLGLIGTAALNFVLQITQ